ncbi:MAG TPA: alanine racemase [Candidatus Polarisedimenticolaceae bacterium]|nr:alanine racemase [Candidatus Polarisedimenticolaceae bacterium]
MGERVLSRLRPGDYRLPDELVGRLLTPALVIYIDLVRDNLRRVIDRAGGEVDRLRIHVKTAKIPAVFAELVAAGIRNYKCATLREARELLQVLHDRQVTASDLLVAYPLREPALGQAAELARRFPATRLSVLCEDPTNLRSIPEELSVFVDVNPGMNRTGVPAADEARITELARAAAGRFRGLHYYDGHVHGKDAAERRAMAHDGYGRLVGLTERLLRRSLPVGEIVTSGTPAFVHALGFDPLRSFDHTVHRVSPGTVVYHDARYALELDELELTPAALVWTRVVSRPADEIATCDAGSKSIAAEAGDPCALVVGHPDYRALRPSEEHLPLAVPPADAPRLGAMLTLIPRHVCPTVNLAEQALLVERGRSPRVVSVSARAHDLIAGE